jgi:hypothetical protein
MRNQIHTFIFLTILCLSAHGQAPRAFFTDLESGPNTGGENNAGAFVTVWGKAFGATRGNSTITVGGGTVANYPIWTDTRITFQLGSRAKTGEIVVHVGKIQSNGLPFAVRPGKIYFVSVSGRDFHSGNFSSPWKSITKAKDSLSRGDIAYIQDGVAQKSEDNFTAYLSMDRRGADNSGTQSSPKALVAYPGAKVTIGVEHGLAYGIRTPNINAHTDYWVISQLHLIAGTQAMDVSGVGWRIIGNDMQCPGADAQVGCVQLNNASQVRFYGNEVHNAGAPPASSKFYHAVYFSTDSNHIDVGWNHIHDNSTCRAIQFHSSPLCNPSCGAADKTGSNQFDLHVHDNLIHGDNCNAINFATVDPSQGPVEAYNNVIYQVGRMDPKGGEGGAFSCIYVAGITYHGNSPSGSVEAFNNTLSDCGGNRSRNAEGSRGAFSINGPRSLTLHLRNNIVDQKPGELYLDGSKSQITGDHNLWSGLGSSPSQSPDNQNADPQFINPAAFDFHLKYSSPAKDGGIAVQPNNSMNKCAFTDIDGVARPQGKTIAIGAYENQP